MEIKKPRIVKFDVLGKIISIPSCISKNLPPIDVLIDSANLNETIEMDTVPPIFLTILVDYFSNNQKLSYLKKILSDEFNEEDILKYLSYLCDTKFIESYFYPQQIINNKIYTTIIRSYISHYHADCTLENNDIIRRIYPDSTLCKINVKPENFKNLHENDLITFKYDDDPEYDTAKSNIIHHKGKFYIPIKLLYKIYNLKYDILQYHPI
jgi:hypothetical protein